MKIIIDVPEKFARYAAALVDIMATDGPNKSNIDGFMNDEPLQLCYDDIEDKEKGKALLISLSIIAIANKVGKIMKDGLEVNT